MKYCSKEWKWNAGLNTETDEIIQMAALPLGVTWASSFNRFVTILLLGMMWFSNPSYYNKLFTILVLAAIWLSNTLRFILPTVPIQWGATKVNGIRVHAMIFYELFDIGKLDSELQGGWWTSCSQWQKTWGRGRRPRSALAVLQVILAQEYFFKFCLTCPCLKMVWDAPREVGRGLGGSQWTQGNVYFDFDW